MYANMDKNAKPNSLKKLTDKTGVLINKLDKIQGYKKSPKTTSPTKPSAGNVRIKETVKETTKKSEMLNKGQFKKR